MNNNYNLYDIYVLLTKIYDYEPSLYDIIKSLIFYKFKGDDVLILVVSPGICQPTLNIELELMALLEDLSHLNGVKIILRLKPVEPIPIFKDFYQNHLNDKGNVMVTAGEYDLFDFMCPSCDDNFGCR